VSDQLDLPGGYGVLKKAEGWTGEKNTLQRKKAFLQHRSFEVQEKLRNSLFHFSLEGKLCIHFQKVSVGIFCTKNKIFPGLGANPSSSLCQFKNQPVRLVWVGQLSFLSFDQSSSLVLYLKDEYLYPNRQLRSVFSR